MAERCCGVIKWFSAEKGYGFIRQDDGTDVIEGDKRKQAQNVTAQAR